MTIHSEQGDKIISYFFEKITTIFFGFAILSLTAVSLVACNNNQTNETDEHINVPATTFMVQPIKSYRVSVIEEQNTIRMRSLTGSIHDIDIYGRTFGGYMWQDTWLNYDHLDSYENIQEIEINGIPGYIAIYQTKNTSTWIANVATEENGLKIIIKAEPSTIREAEEIGETLLNSITIQR